MLFGKKKTVDLKIDGMHCEKCVEKVVAAVKKLGGQAVVDLKLGRASVTCPEAVDETLIAKAIEALGFVCKVIEKK